MLTHVAREKARAFLYAIAAALHRLGLTPNLLTILGFVVVCISAITIAAGALVWGAGLLIFGLGLDAVDGALARLTQRVSKFGAFLDSSLDRYADGVIMLALIWRGSVTSNPWEIVLAAVALMGAFLVSYTRARAEGIGLEMKEGWFTRLERSLVLLLGLFSTAWFGETGLLIALALLAVFSHVTAVQRIFAVKRKLGE